MRRTIVLCLLLAACDGGATLAGGDATPPDGRLFFTRRVASPDYSERRELRMTEDLGRPSVPTAAGTNGRHDRPAVSRDGRYLAWTYLIPNGFGTLPQYGLVTLDRHTGASRQLVGDGVAAGALSWSDDGWLVYLRTDVAAASPTRLVRSRADGSGLEQLLPDDTAIGGGPDIAPNGKRIVWVRNMPLQQVEVAELATGERTTLTTEEAGPNGYGLWDPIWSPDSRQVAYVLFRPGYPMADTSFVRVTDREGRVVAERTVLGHATRPAWSPDGRRIAYCLPASDSGLGRYRSEIRVWRLGSDADESITPTSGDDCDPTWSR